MVRIAQPSFAGGELAPDLYARVDLAKYTVGLKRARNVTVRRQGGIANRPGTRWLGEVADSTARHRLIPFAFNVEDTYALEFGGQTMRVYRQGAQVTEGAVTLTGLTATDPVVVTATAHGYSNGDEVYVSGVATMAQVNGRNFRVASATTNTFALQTLDGADLDGSAWSAGTGGASSRVYEIATPYDVGDLPDLKFVQSADVLYLTHPSHAVRKLSRTGHTAWTLATVTFQPSQAVPTGVSATAYGGGSGTDYYYKVAAISDDTGEESLPSASVKCNNDLTLAGNYNRVSWSATSGAGRYIVYKLDAGVYAYIGGTAGTSFDDDNITPDLSQTVVTANNPFSGAGAYPGCATFFEQRLCFGRTDTARQKVWMSRTANFESFEKRVPLQDDDSVAFTIAARQVNEIRHMVPLEDLIVLTSGGEWRVTGGEQSYITPDSITVRPQSYYGASNVPPILAGNTVLFIQDAGSIVRDLAYKWESDGYSGNDLSILASHFFDGYAIEDWAFAQVPDGLVWCVRDDGALLCLTYVREHEVWGWTLCTLPDADGEAVVESVCAIREGAEDRVYLIVRRTVGGRTVRYVEQMESRRFDSIQEARFLDCALTYDGAAVTTLSGLWHLEGRTVAALANGSVVPDQVVANGAVTVPAGTTKATVGLKYTSQIRTLPVDLNTASGSVQGRRKRVPKVTARLRDSRGLWIGPDDDDMVEWKQRATEAWGAPIEPFTGDADFIVPPAWGSAGEIVIEQRDPLPMMVLGLYPVVDLGG